MAVLTDTKTQTTVEKTLSGILSVLKGKGRTAASGNAGFASLLAETKSASVPQEDASTSRSRATKEAEPKADIDDKEIDARVDDDGRRAASTDKDESSKRVAKADKSEKTSEDDSVVRETAPEDTAASEKVDDVTPEDTAETAAASSERKDDNDDSELDAELQALLAALVPLDGVANKNVAAATQGSKETVSETAPTTDEMTLAPKAMETALKAMEKIKKQIERTSAPGQDGALQPETAQDLSGALEQIAGEISSMKDKTAKIVDEVKTEVAQSMEEISQMLADMSQTTGEQIEKAIAGHEVKKDLMAKSAQAQTQVTTAAQNMQAQAAGAMASNVGVSLQGNAEAMTSATTQSVSTVGATTQPHALAGEGMKTTGFYDFASQLSAARVTKGGAAGLPQAVEQVAVQLHKAVKDGADEITIQLKPVELGKIEITLHFGEDKSVTGTVVADNQATLNMLQKDAESLNRALQEAGLQADSGCLQFSLREDNTSKFAQGQNQGNAGASPSSAADQAEADTSTVPTGVETYYLTPGRVNIHV